MLCGKVFFTAGPPVRVYLFRSSLSRFCINGSTSSQSHLPQMQSADWSASCGPPHIASTSTHMYLSAPHRESGTLPAVRRGPASNPPPASVLQKFRKIQFIRAFSHHVNSCTPVLATVFHIFCKSLQIRSLPVTAVSQKNKIRALSFISGRYSRPSIFP